MPSATPTDSPNPDAGREDAALAFTWLSIADFKRLTPAQKEAYIGRIADHFELGKSSGAPLEPLRRSPEGRPG